MEPEQPQAGGPLRPEPASSSGWPMSADDRLASVIRAHQERMVDDLTSDLWGFDGPWLRRTYPNKAALRLFMEAFVEALRRSFTKRDGKQFVNEYGDSLGRRYAAGARNEEEYFTT